MKTPDVVLDDAANLLEKEGVWCQGFIGKEVDGEIVHACAMGAINVTATGKLSANSISTPAGDEIRNLNLVSKAYELLSRVVNDNIAYWNDTPEQTADDVVTAMRTAAENYRTVGMVIK